jgi:hypothetical protein
MQRRWRVLARPLLIAMPAALVLGACTVTAVEPSRLAVTDLAGSDQGRTASSAETFVQSIGINTHLSYLDTRFPDGTTMVDKIKQSGITNLRDCPCIAAPESPGDTAAVADLISAGARFTVAADFHQNSAQQIHDWVVKLGPQHITSVENRNEPELFDLKDDTWPIAEVRRYQQELFQAIKNDPATRDVEVLGPSLTSAEAAEDFGSSVATSMDRASLHNYAGGLEPENRGFDDKGDGSDKRDGSDRGYGSLDFALRHIASTVKPGGVPPVSTETGNDNAVARGDGQSVPEAVSGRYLPRQYLYSFAAGIPRTYLYEFFDEGTDPANTEQNFGLIRNDGSPKPAYTAIRAMIGLLHDPGPAFAPGRLDLTVNGAPDGLQQVLLQKRDGTFYLAVWLGKRSWNRDTKTEIPVPDADTTITLPASVSKAVAHRLGKSGDMTSQALDIRGSQIQVPVGDEVTFVELGRPGPP